jgi:hypothetical protein
MQVTDILDGVTTASHAAPNPSVSIIVPCESQKIRFGQLAKMLVD